MKQFIEKAAVEVIVWTAWTLTYVGCGLMLAGLVGMALAYLDR